MASFGKHLYATQNNKLAKYTESVNFAYLFKRMPRGFDLQKGPNQKTFGTKRTKSAKQTPRGFNPPKGPNQKIIGTKGTKGAKQTPRGFDLQKGPNQKTFGTISAKQAPRGFGYLKV